MKIGVIAAAIFVASPALAVERATCIDASSKAQDFRVASKLVEAREQVLICANSDCPTVVARDCSQWLTEIDQALPSVSIAARDGGGRDLVAVKVFVDETVWLGAIDGRAHPLNPGPHKLRFESEGLPSTTQDVVIREGEKDRAIVVTLGAPPKIETPRVDVVVQPTTPPTHHATWMKPVGVTTLVLGGLTLAAGGVLAGVAAGQWSQATGTCPIAQPCTDENARSQQSTAATMADWSTALFIGGGVVAAAGLVLVIVSPKSSEVAHVAIAPSAGGFSLSLTGAF